MAFEKSKEAVTWGLLSGYAGKSSISEVNRGGFDLKSSVFEEGGVRYVDQWLPREVGGGQEIVSIDKEEFTRLYAGGLARPEVLSGLGLTGSEVIGYLIRKIVELKGRTRLFDNCTPETDGLWTYIYKLMETDPATGTTVSKETITFQNETVFVHYFLLSSVR